MLEYKIPPSTECQESSFPISGTFAKLQKVTVRIIMSVRPTICQSVCLEQLGSHRMEFYEILYLNIFSKNLSRKFKFHYNQTRIKGTLHVDHYTF